MAILSLSSLFSEGKSWSLGFAAVEFLKAELLAADSKRKRGDLDT